MQCNIDARGKAVRLVGGLILLIAAVGIAALLLLGILPDARWWILAGGLAAFGAIGVFEARAGWCVVRAMGIRTPL